MAVVAALALFAVPPLAPADDTDAMRLVMQLWCTQAGAWRGDIDLTGRDGAVTRTTLVTHHDCTEGGAHHIARERFGPGTVKVTYVDRDAGHFHTAYFASGRQTPYPFTFVGVERKDDARRKTIIASKPGTEQYEGRRAVLRYIRVRDGDVIEGWKDVQFVDGTQDFQPRPRIVQRRMP